MQAATINSSANGINSNEIIRAFQVLVTQATQKQLIKSADQYIRSCETNPNFALILMQIFSQLPNSQTKFQILIHLKNVIKRNWTSKRRSKQISISPATKEQIKSKLLELYKSNWKIYYKQFNQIFKQLSRQQFPVNYPLLTEFVKNILSSIGGLTLQQMMSSQQILPYLSLVKIVYKQFAERRVQHSVNIYTKYVADNVELSVGILKKINQAIVFVRADPQKVQQQIVNKLLECSRKIDKIILYCFQSIVSQLQYNPTIKQIVRFQLTKIGTLLQLLNINIGIGINIIAEVQLNILAIIEQVSKLQQMFPLLLSEFLSDYLQMLIQLLFNHKFKNEKLINCIISANMKPFKAFAYYMDCAQFRTTLEFKRDKNQQNQLNSQKLCNQAFTSIYSFPNILMFLEKLISQTMLQYQRNYQDQIIFQDAEVTHQGAHELSTYQHVLALLKVIMQKFKQQSKVFVQKIIEFLIAQSRQNQKSKVSLNMYEVILLMSKLPQQSQINMGSIFRLMEKCYLCQNFDMFCRLVRNYHSNFDTETVSKSFDILVTIIQNPNSNHHTVYQSLVCIKKLLVDYQNINFPLQKIAPCLTRIFSLLQVYKQVPNHLWNLLNLLIQILKALKTQTVMQNVQSLAYHANSILERKDNGSMTIMALAELLQNILCLIESEDYTNMQAKLSLYSVAVKLIQLPIAGNSQDEEFIEMSKQLLWLCVIKNVHKNYCTQELKSKLLDIFALLKQKVMHEDPSLFIQILQQYLLSGLLQIRPQDIESLYEGLVENTQPDNDVRVNMSFFSLYYTYIRLTQTYSKKIILKSIKKLKQIFGRVSPTINGLRMQIMLGISYQIVMLGGEAIFSIFNQAYPDYKSWFWPYIWSLEYINNKFSAKVVTIALLKSLPLLKQVVTQKIQQNLPFDHIIKFITQYIQPLKLEQAINGYNASLKVFSHEQQLKSRNKFNNGGLMAKNYSRKLKLHVNRQLVQLDLRDIYKQQISQLFKQWDWGQDDLHERYSLTLIEKIVKLLNEYFLASKDLSQ